MMAVLVVLAVQKLLRSADPTYEADLALLAVMGVLVVCCRCWWCLLCLWGRRC